MRCIFRRPLKFMSRNSISVEALPYSLNNGTYAAFYDFNKTTIAKKARLNFMGIQKRISALVERV